MQHDMICYVVWYDIILHVFRKGTNGVSTNGVTVNIMFFFLQRDILGTPVYLRLSSQKCQGVPFSPSCQNSLLVCSGPISVNPICPQPRLLILLLLVLLLLLLLLIILFITTTTTTTTTTTIVCPQPRLGYLGLGRAQTDGAGLHQGGPNK